MKSPIEKAFASWAMREKLITHETITSVEFWKEPASEVQIYSPEELQVIMNRVPRSTIPFVAIGAFAGLRAAEVLCERLKTAGITEIVEKLLSRARFL